MEFAKALKLVATFFEKDGVRYAVIGALGLHAYGLTRATVDLDFVVEEKARPDLVRYLESLGYKTLNVSEGYSNHVHPLPSLGRLDFVYVDMATATALFGNTKALFVLPGQTAPVPRAEHLAAMKILAMKNDPSRTFQEMADIRHLLSLPGVDEEEIRRHFEKHGLESRFHEIKRTMPSP